MSHIVTAFPEYLQMVEGCKYILQFSGRAVLGTVKGVSRVSLDAQLDIENANRRTPAVDSLPGRQAPMSRMRGKTSPNRKVSPWGNPERT